MGFGVPIIDPVPVPYIARQVMDLEAENERLRGLIKVLCSDPSPFGSEAFRRTRDAVNPETRALLLDVLGARPSLPDRRDVAPSTPPLSRAQTEALHQLSDGEWHQGARTVGSTTVLATVAASLWRLGFAERAGNSRTTDPRSEGYRYRITEAGRKRTGTARQEGT